ncbi:hypothetical protein CGSMWGv1400E_06858 [Gardnerella vaginalis 1400E]|uniref:Uncharacterized protein n=1 Tax=Gardnerella vaginalis 1400E TaxID=698956 RepID=I4LST2_GARVA|nr:hypothetical protein CGSMWGv1400E_06858 [Gardnerella vaginalis 1400E]
MPERLKRSARRQFGALSLLKLKAQCAFNASEDVSAANPRERFTENVAQTSS